MGRFGLYGHLGGFKADLISLDKGGIDKGDVGSEVSLERKLKVDRRRSERRRFHNTHSEKALEAQKKRR